MSAVVDIKNAIVTMIETITPSIVAQKTFKERRGSKPIELCAGDTKFHRMFELLYELDIEPMVQVGGGIRIDTEQTITLKIGYLGRRSDIKLLDMVASDQEDIYKYLFAFERSGVWPSSFCGITTEGGGDLEQLTGEGRESCLMVWPFQLQYQV